MDLTGKKNRNSDYIFSAINEELTKTYKVKQFGEYCCNISKNGTPFRLFCFNKEDLSFGIEYASNETEAEKGWFEDGDLFYFDDYASINEMAEDMRREIDDE